jgi:hypothetical protein
MRAMTPQKAKISRGPMPPPSSLSAMMWNGTVSMVLGYSPGFFGSVGPLPPMDSRIEVSAWMLRKL